MAAMQLRSSRLLIQRRPAALEAIKRHYCDFGCSPSFAEIGARIGVEKHHVGKLVRDLAIGGEIGWRPGERRSISLPRRLSNFSNADLLWELQARGLPVHLGRTGEGMAAALVSAWPEATVVDVPDDVAKVEHDLLAQLDQID